MHTSVKIDTPCEIINVTPINPLITKCQIKVCYIGEQPNRNRTVITKEVARQMANTLPGSPIVGYYNEVEGDFEEHNREISITSKGLKLKDGTRPYGFIDLGARCWFQKFLDDGVNEREYLMTEGYLWTGQYPETKRIIDQGNNQSMELQDDYLKGNWTKDSNGRPKIFIINEAVISKLCILGENCEPCFEGSTITKFSLSDDLKTELYSKLMNELQELLNEGGAQVFTTYAVKVGDSVWNALYSFVNDKEYASIEAVLTDDSRNFAVIKDQADKVYSLDFSIAEDGSIKLADEAVAMENYTPTENPQFSIEEVESFVTEFKKKPEDDEEKGKDDKSNNPDSENKTEGKNSDSSSDEKDAEDPTDNSDKSDNQDKNDEEDKKKKKYTLEEIPEYVDLSSKYSDLESKYNTLLAEKEALDSELSSLKEFKLSAERVQKQDMIKNEFYMLSDEDKKDVIDHIDEYSLEDIESKLSVICVRNKVSFAAIDDDKDNGPTTFSLGGNLYQDNDTPAWVKAVLETAKTLN